MKVQTAECLLDFRRELCDAWGRTPFHRRDMSRRLELSRWGRGRRKVARQGSCRTPSPSQCPGYLWEIYHPPRDGCLELPEGRSAHFLRDRGTRDEIVRRSQ